MIFSRLFSWLENKKKFNYLKNQKNNELIFELKVEGITNEKILSAIKKVPRELFVEQHLIKEAYQNNALPTDCGQTVSQPYVVAYMISFLNLKNTDKILEIGTGTGWQTAILSHLCKEVFTIERFNVLLNKAKKNIAKLNIKNINYKLGNGIMGWGQKVLFDAIIISATSEVIPEKLLENLKSNGRLIMPKKYHTGNQKLLLINKKNENHFDKEELLDVKFVPLLNKDSVK
tara:strand:- start:273 stop:965 length:693 start_codon:yes stop_codon:yes gene_type:complete